MEPKFEPKIETNSLTSREKVPGRTVHADAKQALQMMLEAKNELPPEIQRLIEKKAKNKKKQKLNEQEIQWFVKVRSLWWLKKFGVLFELRNFSPGKVSRLQKKRLENKPWLLEEDAFEKIAASLKSNPAKPKLKTKTQKIIELKQALMQELVQSTKNLDLGEPVEEFRDESRKVVHYDKDKEKYYVLENNLPKYLGVEDIKSDFAWGIKYVPDGEMTEPFYRRIAKQILTNEARRKLEMLRDREPVSFQQHVDVAPKPTTEKLESLWLKRRDAKNRQKLDGFIAEVMARELVARVAEDVGHSFKVERSSAVEDGEYKIDFKVRIVRHRRGVSVGEEEKIENVIHKVGIQFTINKYRHSTSEILKVKSKWAGKLPVDDIVVVRVPTSEFGDAYDRWLKEGKPSGGPEQFLSQEVKDRLLEAVTQGLFDKKEE